MITLPNLFLREEEHRVDEVVDDNGDNHWNTIEHVLKASRQHFVHVKRV